MYDELIYMLYSIPAIIIAFTVHELGHAQVAVWLGDDTPRQQGRLTLNPLRHIDWFGFLFLLLLQFGWAKPVMINLSKVRHGRWGAVFISLAGVTCNLLLGILAIIIYVALSIFLPAAPVFIKAFFSVLVQVNISLLIFNLLPIPPLDGYRVIDHTLGLYRTPFMVKFERFGFLLLFLLLFLGIADSFLFLCMQNLISFFEDAARMFFSLFVS